MARRLFRALARISVVAFIVALSGVTYAARAEQASRAEFKPLGLVVDIGGGQSIYLRTWGTRHGGDPAIVLDASAGTPSSEWAWVGQMLAADGHFVVAYDRPGIAWSTGPDHSRDAMSAAEALDKAMAAADISAPYVVVGHSYGGFSARAFAGTHATDIAGLVLLDTTDPDGGGGPGFALTYRLMAWRAAFGLYALSPPPDDFWELPTSEQDAANAISKWPSFLDTAARELETWDVSAAQIRPLELTSMPLLVVCVPSSPEHVAQQRHIAALSDRSRYVEHVGDHMGMLLDHDQAAATVHTIENFIETL